MLVILKIIKESVMLALQELFKNKLRSFLSLLGVTIGILCIISVLTAVDSLKKNLKEGFESLGSTVVYVEKWPIIFSDDYPWWKFVKRPEVDFSEFRELKDRLNTASACAIVAFAGRHAIKLEGKEISGVEVIGSTYDYEQIQDIEFQQGRYFSPMEMQMGRNNILLGANVAEKLFSDGRDAVGSKVKLFGREVTVIGILKKQGSSMVDLGFDDRAILPYSYLKSFLNTNRLFLRIAVKAKEEIPVEELKYEITGIMRSVRKLQPKENENFAINEMSILTDGLETLFGFVSFAGGLIGIISIFVGGFGIANIMFVSVKERTNIIGIKKALGAKRVYILLEFLIESVLLCIIGGLAGLLLVFLLFQAVEYFFLTGEDNTFNFTISIFFINFGILLSFVIGVLAGIIPAILASKMKPVEAMRS